MWPARQQNSRKYAASVGPETTQQVHLQLLLFGSSSCWPCAQAQRGENGTHDDFPAPEDGLQEEEEDEDATPQ